MTLGFVVARIFQSLRAFGKLVLFVEECVVSCELFGDSEFSNGRQGVPKGLGF